MATSILLKFLTLKWNILRTIWHIEVGDGSFFCIFYALSFELNFFFDRRFPLAWNYANSEFSARSILSSDMSFKPNLKNINKNFTKFERLSFGEKSYSLYHNSKNYNSEFFQTHEII